MGSNGADNAHNNAFGGGKNPGIGGGSNSSGSHSSGNGGGNANSGSGWSNVNTTQGTLHAYTGGETSGYVGSKGNGGQQVVGWGWKMDDRPETAKDYVDANGQVRITITKGLVKAPVYGPVAGGNQGNGGHRRHQEHPRHITGIHYPPNLIPQWMGLNTTSRSMTRGRR